MEGGGGGANLSAPPAWASSATWLNGALSLDLPNVKRAMEVEAILVEDKEVCFFENRLNESAAFESAAASKISSTSLLTLERLMQK